jgi:hypothetical protein
LTRAPARSGYPAQGPGLSRPSTFFRAIRHGRACPGHPRSFPPRARTWIPGTRPGMTAMGRCVTYGLVRIVTAHETAGGCQTSSWPGEATSLLRADVPEVARHGRASPGHPRSFPPRARTWMPGTRPGMTVMGRCVAYAVVGIGTARMKRRSSNVRHGLGETTKLASRRRPGRGSSSPGLSRPSTCFGAASKDVDTRHKAGHDGDGAVRRLRSYAHHDGAHETAVIKRRHGRACPGHPRASARRARTWMPGTRPGMTALRVL